MTATTVRKEASPPQPMEGTAGRETPRLRRRQGSSWFNVGLTLPLHLTWVITLVLLVIGLCMMLSVSTAVSGPDKLFYLRNQGITAALGVGLMVLLSRVDYRKVRGLSVAFLAVVVLSLLVVHVPGVARVEGGARSYISMGPFTYQPSEFAKLAVVLAGAHILSSPRVGDGRFRSYMVPFGVCGLLMCLLVLWERDLGTAIIICGLMMGMLWMGGIKGRHILLMGGAGLGAAAGLILSSSERSSRITVLWNPTAHASGSGWQLSQSLIALGRGGWFGVGPGQSVQKYQYLPKARSDMIFAILGEEFGLVGAGLVILLFVALAIVCWRLARRCNDPLGRLLIAGCGMLVTLEAVVNIGGVIGALPLTGVPLPFISYGRNSLLVMLAAVGLILAVGRRAPHAAAPSLQERYENVTRIDRRRGDSRTRGARAGAR